MSNLTITPKNNLQSIDKHEIEDIAKRFESDVLDGVTDPIEALIAAKKGQEIYKAIEKRIRPIAEEQAQIPKGDKILKYYAEVTQGETGVKYDYSSCGDTIWVDLSERAAEITAALKEREKFLQGVTKEQGCFDPETGDSWTVTPPLRTGKLGLKITLK